jgi:hypothetical protein
MGWCERTVFFKWKKGVTDLNIVMDATEEFKESFSTTFPKALEVVKQISEQ